MFKNTLFTTFLFCQMLNSIPSLGCSLLPTEARELKKKMAAAVSQKIGQGVDAAHLTVPRLHTPLGLGADCSGLASYHHSAGFRVESGESIFEGVVVLLGYWYDAPVAVNFTKRLRTPELRP